MINFFRRFNYGEFIAIWTCIILLVTFYVFLLYNFLQIKKGTNLLKRNLKRILDLLPEEHFDILNPLKSLKNR